LEPIVAERYNSNFNIGKYLAAFLPRFELDGALHYPRVQARFVDELCGETRQGEEASL